MLKDDRPSSRHGRFTKLLLILAGHLSLILGLAGILLPLLPTTPFLLLAAACYVRGSETMYNWLLNQRLLGPYIANYRDGGGVSPRLKVTIILLLWCTISLSAFLIDAPYIRLLLLAIAVAVSLLILRLPTRKARRDRHK